MSTQVPYQPLRSPEKHVSQDRMRQILEKNAKVTQSPKEKSGVKVWPTASTEPEPPPTRPRGPLQWQRPEPGSTGVRTVCEWYSCCKVMIDGVWVYEVWTREPLTGGMKQLAVNLPSFEEGRKVAQADADKQP